jgi:hypothetical protein
MLARISEGSKTELRRGFASLLIANGLNVVFVSR